MRKFELNVPLLSFDKDTKTTTSFDDESIPDSHLLILQICRATIAAGMLLSALACITTTEELPRIKLQCALITTACGVSSLFYRHLYELRRLPDYMGYSQEANAVSNALRFTSWAVTIALLAWIAFLLRGPFKEGALYVGLSYKQWLYTGPVLASLNVLLGIPGWEAARVFSGTTKINCTRVISGLLAVLFLGFGFMISITINVAMHLPTTSARSNSEVNLSRWLSWIWVAYPMLQLLKTVAVFIGADHMPRLTTIASQFLPIHKTRRAVQFAFKTMVSAPVRNARAMHNLYTMIEPDHGASIDLQLSAPTIHPQWTQMLDTVMAIVDTLSQGVLALVLVSYALPIEK
jgi:hypothetical protein